VIVVGNTGPSFDYEFSVWPHEHDWARQVYDLFRSLPRVSITLTEAEFADLRDGAERGGLTLREVERVPHHEPEAVL
jgi:hypothetical protein